MEVLALYVRVLANRMKLSDWTIDLLDEPSSPGTYADINCARARKQARLRVCEEFFGESPECRRHTIVHELIHPHLHPILAAVYDLKRVLGQQQFQIFRDRVLDALEYAVDGLADAFAESLPTMEELMESIE